MRQTGLCLTKKDREALESFRSKGSHMAREVNRAHILAALDRKVPESQIMAVLGVGRTAIWRTRATYLQDGLEFALRDAPRPGKPKRYQTDDEAQVAALACSAPPEWARRSNIAGPYRVAQYTPRGLISSSNQHVYHLSPRYANIDFTRLPCREAIIHPGGTVTLTGTNPPLLPVHKRPLDDTNPSE